MALGFNKGLNTASYFSFSSKYVMESSNSTDWVPEIDFLERPRSVGCYSFYHVMWIEWQEEIAYRKGLGRVRKDVWECD